MAKLCHSGLIELQRTLGPTSSEMGLQAAPFLNIKESGSSRGTAQNPIKMYKHHLPIDPHLPRPHSLTPPP